VIDAAMVMPTPGRSLGRIRRRIWGGGVGGETHTGGQLYSGRGGGNSAYFSTSTRDSLQRRQV
jgi:hypothetical protein